VKSGDDRSLMLRPGSTSSTSPRTGDIAQHILEQWAAAGRARRRGRVTVCDLTTDMVAIGRDRAIDAAGSRHRLGVGDARPCFRRDERRPLHHRLRAAQCQPPERALAEARRV